MRPSVAVPDVSTASGTRIAGAASRAAVAAAAAVLWACGDHAATGPTAAATTGTLSVALTDAPFPFDSVVTAELYVVRVEGRLAETDSAGAEAGAAAEDRNQDPARGWVTLAAPRARIDLLALRGGRTRNLGLATLPTGTYRGFRLVLDTDSSRVTLTNGVVLTGASSPGITFPSAGRTGIKIALAAPIAVTAGGTQMVVDFDLGRSFVPRGNSVGRGGLLFKPVVRATATDVTGALAGTVVADSAGGRVLAAATVEVLSDGTAPADTAAARVVATATTDSAGTFVAAFLLPGRYAVRASKAAGTAARVGFVPSATVVAGARTGGVTVVAR